MNEQHPSTAAILRHFTYDHLPAHLREISRPICERPTRQRAAYAAKRQGVAA
jgi:hypothetical protein